MKISMNVLAFALAANAGTPVAEPPASSAQAPQYEADGRLQLPADYREWVYLSSGLDMSYRERAGMTDHSMFDNVFVDRAAYRDFVATGSWPDPTVLVMEVRGATSKGSINKTGKFQTADLMGMEVHVKDTRRFEGGWAFFVFDGAQLAAALPQAAECYACHRQHGAVDTTFVQFYPTLLGIAEGHQTLSKTYREESAKSGEPVRETTANAAR
ncbi:MAG: cytochrome P460 family protein [Dokdonella sp.]